MKMNKFSTFVLGTVVGAALMFVSLKYHIVRARDGIHWVPKVMPTMRSIYTDVRGFTVDDWRSRQELMIAITHSDNAALQEEAAKSALGNSWESAWDSWSNVTP